MPNAPGLPKLVEGLEHARDWLARSEVGARGMCCCWVGAGSVGSLRDGDTRAGACARLASVSFHCARFDAPAGAVE